MVIVEVNGSFLHRIVGPFDSENDAYLWINRMGEYDIRYKWSVVKTLENPHEVEDEVASIAP